MVIAILAIILSTFFGSSDIWAIERTARGGEFILSNPVKDISSITGAFRQEIDYLINKGYILNSSGTKLIKK